MDWICKQLFVIPEELPRKFKHLKGAKAKKIVQTMSQATHL